MKIYIKNLGPISYFEFDLKKDLSLIFGENNIGKSYAITAIYIIIKNLINAGNSKSALPFEILYFRRDFYYHGLFESEIANSMLKGLEKSENQILNNFLNSEDNEIEVTNIFVKVLKKIIDASYLSNLKKSFDNSFESVESLSNRISGKQLSIKLEYQNFSMEISLKKQNLYLKRLKLNSKIYLKKAKTNRALRFTPDRTTNYLNVNKKKKELNLGPLIGKYMLELREEVSNQIKNIYFLPASRSGLYQALSTFSAVIAELSKSRNFLSNKIELPNISEPVSDYFLYLSNINSKKNNAVYSEIVKNIEHKILEGKVNFNEESKKIVFSPSKLDIELDLSFTSSMISEIAPIVAFLKYIVSEEEEYRTPFYFRRKKGQKQNPSNLIFIEEPEAHLHPKVQVLLMEIFTYLTKNNTKIVMTTHSNYMFNKLSNLILGKNIKPEKVGSYLMEMIPGEGSVVDLKSMVANEEGIRDENFIEVAEKLYNERINIYDKLNK